MTSNDTCAPPILSRRFAVYDAPNSQSLVNLAPLCARVARAVEDGGLNASAVALARAPPSQQTRLLRVPSSPSRRLLSPAPGSQRTPRRLTILALANHASINSPPVLPQRLPWHAFEPVPDGEGHKKRDLGGICLYYLYNLYNFKSRSARPRRGLHVSN